MESEPIPPFPDPENEPADITTASKLVYTQLASAVRSAELLLRRLEGSEEAIAPADRPDLEQGPDPLAPETVEELNRELSEAFDEATEEEQTELDLQDDEEEQAAARTRAPLTFSAEPASADDLEQLDADVSGIADASVVLEFKDGGYTSKFKPKSKKTPGLVLPS